MSTHVIVLLDGSCPRAVFICKRCYVIASSLISTRHYLNISFSLSVSLCLKLERNYRDKHVKVVSRAN